MVLNEVDVDLAGVVVDPVDDPGRQHAPFAEDPEPGIDDDVAAADVVSGGVEVADAPSVATTWKPTRPVDCDLVVSR